MIKKKKTLPSKHKPKVQVTLPPAKIGRPITWTPEKINELGMEYLQYVKSHPDMLFQGEFFDEEKSLPEDTFSYLCARSPEFARLISTVKRRLETRILKAMSWTRKSGANAASLMFVLKNQYGYAEKTETKLTVDKDIELNFGNTETEDKDKR
jgi:hypothetical protein